MDTCPFCGTEIGRDIAVHGGSCHRCLARIPGEDAPTEIGPADPIPLSSSVRRGWATWGIGMIAVALTLVTGTVLITMSDPTVPEMVADQPAVELPPVVGVARGAALEQPVEEQDGVLRHNPAVRRMIGSRLRTAVPELQHCYTRRLQQDPEAAGRYRLVLAVTETGGVDDVRVEPMSEPDPVLQACLTEHVQSRWTFDPIAQRTVVSRTLTFQPPRNR